MSEPLRIGLPEKEKKTRNLTFRVTPTEAARIEQARDKLGFKATSDFLLYAAHVVDLLNTWHAEGNFFFLRRDDVGDREISFELATRRHKIILRNADQNHAERATTKLKETYSTINVDKPVAEGSDQILRITFTGNSPTHEELNAQLNTIVYEELGLKGYGLGGP